MGLRKAFETSNLLGHLLSTQPFEVKQSITGGCAKGFGGSDWQCISRLGFSNIPYGDTVIPTGFVRTNEHVDLDPYNLLVYATLGRVNEPIVWDVDPYNMHTNGQTAFTTIGLLLDVGEAKGQPLLLGEQSSLGIGLHVFSNAVTPTTLAELRVGGYPVTLPERHTAEQATPFLGSTVVGSGLAVAG
jgi:hypothetical protein